VREASFFRERILWEDGLSSVAGIDEAGRGAWAGPLYAAAVVFPPKVKLPFPLFDSKALAPKRRVELAKVVRSHALAFSFGVAEVPLIERCGISYATEHAMLQALEGLGLSPDFVLIDFFKIRSFPRWQQEGIVKGDQLSASIAAASILAKVERDSLMSKFDQVYPGYNFALHKGYGTRVHQEALGRLGLSKVHRPSFIPKKILQ